MSVLAEHFGEHLQELRQRLLITMAAVVLCSGAAYLFSQEIARLFVSPLLAANPALTRLVYTNLTEAFVSYLKLSLLIGVICSFPVLCYQLWMFISPGLHPNEKRVALKVVLPATFLFAAGAIFCYRVVLPLALSFLVGFADERLIALPKFDAYLTFVARTVLAFGLAFEVPFLMVAADRTGLVRRDYFVRKRSYFYGAIGVLAFLLTAGDPLAAVLLAVPLVGLYEGGLLIMRLFASPV